MSPELQELYNERDEIRTRMAELSVQLNEVSAAYNQIILDNITINQRINQVEGWNG